MDVGIRDKVILNVGGIRHETYVSTLRNIPDTRLYSLTKNNPTQLPEFDTTLGEFFFDRHPIVFAQILNYYRTGKLHCPSDVCGPLFEDELAFWGLEDAGIETCCWMNFKKHGEAQANLSSFDKMVEETISEHEHSFLDDEGEVHGGHTRRSYRQLLKKWQPKIWITLEEPSSSTIAKIITITTMLLIIASVVVTCLETVHYFSKKNSVQQTFLKVIESICIVWFTIEFLIRIIVCPSKRDFSKQIMNWLDLAAIVPFYVQLFLTNTHDNETMVALRVTRLIRVFRVFKLCRHSYSLQILGHTLRSSLSELFLLGFFLTIGIIVFSSLIYYAESEVHNTKFSSIPASFWWAVITMTTVGYGDFVPTTWLGRAVGTCCAICGVLTVALPIPVIVSNFSLYYSHAKARQKSIKKKKPLVIGAANALKIIDPLVGPRTDPNRYHTRTWPTVALEMAGVSFEGSESSPNLPRKFSNIRIKDWSRDSHQSSEPECAVDIRNEIRRDERSSVETINSPPTVFNDDQFKLPTIQIQSVSSSPRNTSPTHELDSITPLHEADGVPERRARNQSLAAPPKGRNGRMGRRDSVFVVGFIGKKWMAKAAKNRYLHHNRNIKTPEKQPHLLTPDFNHPVPFDRESICTTTTGISTPAMSASPNSPVSRSLLLTPHENHFGNSYNKKDTFDFGNHLKIEECFGRRCSCPPFLGGNSEHEASLNNQKIPLKAWKSSQSYQNFGFNNQPLQHNEQRHRSRSTGNYAEFERNLTKIEKRNSYEHKGLVRQKALCSGDLMKQIQDNELRETQTTSTNTTPTLSERRNLPCLNIDFHDHEDNDIFVRNYEQYLKPTSSCKSIEKVPNKSPIIDNKFNFPNVRNELEFVKKHDLKRNISDPNSILSNQQERRSIVERRSNNKVLSMEDIEFSDKTVLNKLDNEDYLNAGCILKFPFLENRQFERPNSFILNIKDETVV